MQAKTVIVNDKMQRGYRYALLELEGKNFDPQFKPELSPKQMLAMGVFGGRYLRDCRKEFPTSWYSKAKLHPPGVAGHSRKLNIFGRL